TDPPRLTDGCYPKLAGSPASTVPPRAYFPIARPKPANGNAPPSCGTLGPVVMLVTPSGMTRPKSKIPKFTRNGILDLRVAEAEVVGMDCASEPDAINNGCMIVCWSSVREKTATGMVPFPVEKVLGSVQLRPDGFGVK